MSTDTSTDSLTPDMDDEDFIDPDNTGDIEIVRDEENVVTGFKGDPDLVPEYVHDNPAALVTGLHGFEFDTPVWAHGDTFMEMEEAGILGLSTDPQKVTFGPHEVWIYETQA